MNPLIPAGDPGPLPGPTWIFHLLWVVTFSIHLLMVNAVLGGTVLSAIALARGRAGAGRGIAAWFASINTWAISFAITFAIAPLLFLQLLYGRFFYSATTLVAGGWLAMLGLLTGAYYLGYLVKRLGKTGATPSLLVFVQALLFLTIAGIQVAVSLLQQRPDRWGVVSDHPWAVLRDPVFVPRYLHLVFAAVAMAGGGFAWWRLRTTGPAAVSAGPSAVRGAEMGAGAGGEIIREPETGTDSRAGGVLPARVPGEFDGEVRFGIHAAIGATALQVPLGFWMLFALPREVLIGFMRGGAGTMMPLTLGILTGVGAIVALSLCLLSPARPRLVRHGLELIMGTTILMVITRHQLRAAYLAPESVGGSMVVAPQWGVIGIFVLCFLSAVALLALALVCAAKDRAGPGEDAA